MFMVPIKITQDQNRAKSIYQIALLTINMIAEINAEKYSILLIKEYHDVIRELCSAIMYIDGFKTDGKNANRQLFEYIAVNYLTDKDRFIIDELRNIRNKMIYEGVGYGDNFAKEKLLVYNQIAKKLLDVIATKNI